MSKIPFFRLEQLDDNIWVYQSDAKLIQANIIIYLGTHSTCVPPGYAHLLEHMMINANYESLKTFENLGGVFNGSTLENHTEFSFLDMQGKNLDRSTIKTYVSKFLKSGFTEKSLSVEKLTILNEYNISELNWGKKDTNIRLGSKEEINNFSLSLLNNIKFKTLSDAQTILFYPGSTNLRKNNFDSQWYKNVKIKCIREESNNITNIYLEDDFYSKLLFYSIKILLNDVVCKKAPKYEQIDNMCKINISVTVDEFSQIISNYKDKSLERYGLLFNHSFKFASSEVCSIIALMKKDMCKFNLIDDTFYNSRWERLIL